MLVRWLSHHIAPGQCGEDRVSGSREPAAPVRLDVLSMINPAAEHVTDPDGDQIGPPSIPTTLKSWAWLIAEHRGLVYPEKAGVDELTEWLLRHLDWATTRPWVTDMMSELAELRQAAHALAPWRKHVQEMVGPCPSCGKRALIHVAGEPYIECDSREWVGGCGDLWTYEEYSRHVAELVTTAKKSRRKRR